MTDAPKTIWAWPYTGQDSAGQWSMAVTSYSHEYTLTSSIAAQLKAADELAARCEAWLTGGITWDGSLSEALTAYRKAKDEAQ